MATEHERKFRKGVLKARQAAETIDAFLWDISEIEDDGVADAIKDARQSNSVLMNALAGADSRAISNSPVRDAGKGIQRPLFGDDDEDEEGDDSAPS